MHLPESIRPQLQLVLPQKSREQRDVLISRIPPLTSWEVGQTKGLRSEAIEVMIVYHRRQRQAAMEVSPIVGASLQPYAGTISKL